MITEDQFIKEHAPDMKRATRGILWISLVAMVVALCEGQWLLSFCFLCTPLLFCVIHTIVLSIKCSILMGELGTPWKRMRDEQLDAKIFSGQCDESSTHPRKEKREERSK